VFLVITGDGLLVVGEPGGVLVYVLNGFDLFEFLVAVVDDVHHLQVVFGDVFLLFGHVGVVVLDLLLLGLHLSIEIRVFFETLKYCVHH